MSASNHEGRALDVGSAWRRGLRDTQSHLTGTIVGVAVVAAAGGAIGGAAAGVLGLVVAVAVYLPAAVVRAMKRQRDEARLVAVARQRLSVEVQKLTPGEWTSTVHDLALRVTNRGPQGRFRAALVAGSVQGVDEEYPGSSVFLAWGDLETDPDFELVNTADTKITVVRVDDPRPYLDDLDRRRREPLPPRSIRFVLANGVVGKDLSPGPRSPASSTFRTCPPTPSNACASSCNWTPPTP